MPLSTNMEFIIKKEYRRARSVKWANKYGAQFLNTPNSEDIKGVLLALIEAERALHTTEVSFVGGLGRRFRPKNIVPDPNPNPIDPTDIVPVTYFGLGQRSVGGEDETMTREHILQVDRESEVGRIGWLEFRGALLESDVQQSIDGMTGENDFAIDGLVDTFNTTLLAMAGGLDFQWVRVSQPQIDKTVIIVDNKPKTTRLYGAPIIIDIQKFVYRGIRTDNYNHKYFDRS